MVNIKGVLIPVDVDFTLVRPYTDTGLIGFEVIDPADETKTLLVEANEAMVRLVKEEFARGHLPLVWSRRGQRWAQIVVEALRLVPYVAFTADKPLAYFDDLDCNEWMKDRVFIPFETKYYK